jgi:hypothetical protein
MKVKWAMCRKRDVQNFRAEIQGHTSSVELLLLTVHMEATTLHARNQAIQGKTFYEMLEGHSNMFLGKLSSIAETIAQGVEQGKALIHASTRVLQTNIRVFQMLREIQIFIRTVPAQIERQQPIYLVDPFNRQSPFYLEFIRSKAAFLSVLKENFKSLGCDSRLIENEEFIIEEQGTGSLIDIFNN